MKFAAGESSTWIRYWSFSTVWSSSCSLLLLSSWYYLLYFRKLYWIITCRNNLILRRLSSCRRIYIFFQLCGIVCISNHHNPISDIKMIPSWNSCGSLSASGPTCQDSPSSLTKLRNKAFVSWCYQNATYPLGCLFLNWQMSSKDNPALDTLMDKVQYGWTPHLEQWSGIIPKTAPQTASSLSIANTLGFPGVGSNFQSPLRGLLPCLSAVYLGSRWISGLGLSSAHYKATMHLCALQTSCHIPTGLQCLASN